MYAGESKGVPSNPFGERMTRRTKTIPIRMSEEEHRGLRAQAKVARMTLSAFLRSGGGGVELCPPDELGRWILANQIANQLNFIARKCETALYPNDLLEAVVTLVSLDRAVNALIKNV